MAYAFVFLLISLTLVVAVTPSWSKNIRLAALVPTCIAFAILYLSVSDKVAQDRDEYYAWYREAEVLLQNTESRDRFFSWLLSLLPDGLSTSEFAVVLAVCFVVLLTYFPTRLAGRLLIPWEYVPLVILVAITDRLFLDASLNATRGSIAVLLFLIGSTSSSTNVGRVLLWAIAFGVHGRLTTLLLLIYALALIIGRRPFLERALIVCSMVAFGARILIGRALVPEFEALDVLLSFIDSESVNRGFLTATELSASLAVQTAIAVVIPSIAVLLYSYKPPGATAAGPADQEHPLWHIRSFALITCALGLALFPDIVMVQRLFLVSLICLPLFIPVWLLRPLVVTKLLLITVILAGQFR
jgi:hypothetical protein